MAGMRSSDRKRRLLSVLSATLLLALLVVGVVLVVSAIRAHQKPKVHTVAGSTVVRQYRAKLPALKEAAEQQPNSAGARSAYAQALYVTGDKQTAKKEYEAAIRLNPGSASLRNNLGNVYRDLGDYTGAASAYRIAYKLDPSLINAYINLATMQAYTLNKPDDAVETYKLAISKNSQTPELLLLLGGAYERNHQDDQALSTYRTILDKDPNNTVAKRNIERLTKH